MFINKRLFKQTLIISLLLGLILAYPSFSLANENSELYNQPYLNLIKANTTASVKTPAIVAIIDEGVDLNHPDLKEYIWTNSQGLHGWNFLNNSADLTPQGSHGTEVAGVIQEVAGAGNVTIMPLIACVQTFGCQQSAIISAIHYATDNGAAVINLSFGLIGQNNFSDDFNEAIAYAYRHNVVIVAAAGNGESNRGLGQNLSLSPVSPVCNDNGQNMVLGVSSVSGSGAILAGANYGRCVDVVAPGENIFTTTPGTQNGQLYGYFSGSSFSAAEVSGLAALIKGQSPAATARQVIDLIISNAENSAAYQNQFGGGLINVQTTLRAAQNLLAENSPVVKKTTAAKKPGKILGLSITKQPAKTPAGIHPRGQ